MSVRGGVRRPVSDDQAEVEALRRENATLRAELEAALAREGELRAIYHGALDAIVIADDDGRFVDANPAALELFGVAREELLGKTAADFSEMPDFDARWREFLEIGRAEGQLELVRPDGERRILEYRAASSIAPSRHISVLRDLTGRRRFEEHLSQADRLASLGRLAGGIAHDFNELLTTVLSFADFVRTELAPTHPRQGDLTEILLVAGRAYELVRQLLAFGRRLPLEPRTFGIGGLVADVAHLTYRLLPEEVELVIVPGTGEVFADPALIQDVLVGLVLNARDALPQGGTIKVETAMERVPTELATPPIEGLVDAGSYAVVKVSDDGVGMTPAVRQRVFEPFFSTKEGAEGLGLAAAHGIVEQSGGHITVGSEPGRGTTVCVYLPAVRDSHPPSLREASLPGA